MKVEEPGHIYQFQTLDLESPRDDRRLVDQLIFVNREKGKEHPGTQTQDVLRALIDRTMHCDNCIPWQGNPDIIHHMRMAIAYHEARALERKAEKGLYFPEMVVLGPDGHFSLTFETQSGDHEAYHRRRYGSENPSLRRA
jgi:hypothetical protein